MRDHCFPLQKRRLLFKLSFFRRLAWRPSRVKFSAWMFHFRLRASLAKLRFLFLLAVLAQPKHLASVSKCFASLLLPVKHTSICNGILRETKSLNTHRHTNADRDRQTDDGPTCGEMEWRLAPDDDFVRTQDLYADETPSLRAVWNALDCISSSIVCR